MKNTDNHNVELLADELKEKIKQIYGRQYEELSTKEKEAFLASELGESLENLRKAGGQKSKLIENQDLKPYSHHTLTRLLGNNPNEHKMSIANLNATALFLGYDSFGDFLKKKTKKPETMQEKKPKMDIIEAPKSMSSEDKDSGFKPKRKKNPNYLKILATTIMISLLSFFSIKSITDILSNPMLIVGLALLLFFGLYRLIVSSGIIQPLTQEDSSRAVYLILKYGFYIALVTVVLGLIIGVYRNTTAPSTESAERLVIQEVLANARQLDARLVEIDFALEGLRSNSLNNKIKATNDTLFPKGGSEWNKGYDQLILQERLNTIQQVIASRPLQREFGASVVNNIINSQPKYEELFFSYQDQLNHVEWRTQTLQKTLTSNITTTTLDDRLKEINQKYQSLFHHSIVAHIYGIKIINGFNPKNTRWIQETFINIKKINPKQLLNEEQLNDLLLLNLSALTQINNTTSQGINEKELAIDSSLKELEKIVIDLEKADENDGMAEVGGKIITLRGFGRIKESIQKSEEFRKRFAKNDKDWNRYVDISQKLSEQAIDLDVYKGKYIMKLNEDSPLQKGGLEPTDIIIYIDNQIAADMVEQADLDRINNKVAELVYLRLQSSGDFVVKKAKVKNILKGATIYGI